MNLDNDFTELISKLHTTKMGEQRIKRNLGVQTDDAVEWCKTAVLNARDTSMIFYFQKGKNIYVQTPDIEIIVNATSFTIITAHKLKTIIRPIVEEEYCVLREFLYQAIFIPKGVQPPSRDMVDKPEIFVYIKDFSKFKGDLGVVAEHGGQIVGAAWTRIIPAFGHIDNQTPELAISLFPENRGRGMGTKMMKKLFELLRKHGFKQTSLSVQTDNPAVEFYKRLGYKIIAERPDGAGHQDYLMLKEL